MNRPSLSAFISGWTHAIVEPYFSEVGLGIEVERQRLLGSRFLVVSVMREYSYNDLYETASLGGGFVDKDEALAEAMRLCRLRIEQTLAETQNRRVPWYIYTDFTTPQWPAMPWRENMEFPVFFEKVGDGSGFYSREFYSAVFAIDTHNPLTGELVQAVNLDSELVVHFKESLAKSKLA